MGFGRALHVELGGASHSPSLSVEIHGVPKDTSIDLLAVQAALDRRRPVGRSLATRRQELDRLVVDGGLQDGRTAHDRLRFHVQNEDARPSDYEPYRHVPRPGHADFPARTRWGDAADLAGGGIFSGRMTVGLVIAGAIAAQLLAKKGIRVVSFTESIADITLGPDRPTSIEALAAARDANEVGCPEPEAAARMAERIAGARREGDSVGGIIETRAEGLPVGLGEPFFDSVESVIAHLVFSIPAVKAIEFGAGFGAARMRGSEHNDAFVSIGGQIRTRTNHAGGILGGLSTGMPLCFRVAVKPTSSIAVEQESIDLRSGAAVRLRVGGRHDPCIVPRAVVVVESVAAWAIADLGLAGGFLP